MPRLSNPQGETTMTDDTDKKTRTPYNLKRAAKFRSKASMHTLDFKQLDKWEKNDTAEGHVAELRAELEGVVAALNKCADLYEALPESVMRSSRGRRAAKFEPGMIARVREKYADAYLKLTDGEPIDHLKVVGKRGDSHVLIELPDGVRMFVLAKELEPREDA